MQITLLQQAPIDKSSLGQELQADLFNYLLDQQGSQLTMSRIVQDLGCKSPLPILSRLKHLEAQGLVEIS